MTRTQQKTNLTTVNSNKNKVDLNIMATVLTSFKVPDYEKYAHRFFESWVKYWPKGIKLVAYYDGGRLPNNVVKASNITYVNLDKNKDLLDFKSKNAQFNGGEPYNYRMDVLKFSNKVFAICDYARTIKSTHKYNNWLVWIDADVITTKKISHDYLNLLFPDTSDIVHLGREGVIDYSETGFIGFNLMYNKARDFLRDWRNMYTTNEILGLREWSDAFSFERLLRQRLKPLTTLLLRSTSSILRVVAKVLSILFTNPVRPDIEILRLLSNTTVGQNFLRLVRGTVKEHYGSLRRHLRIQILSIMLDWIYLKTEVKNWIRSKRM